MAEKDQWPSLCVLFLSLLLLADLHLHCHGYPVSGSWFRLSSNVKQVEKTLTQFSSIGGNIVYLRGERFLNRTSEDIQHDPLYKSCVDGSKTHCVDAARELLYSHGISITHWLTYSHDDNYSDKLIQCPGFDKKILAEGVTYFQQVLWSSADKSFDDCKFVNGSQVAVLFTAYRGSWPDPQELMLRVASQVAVSQQMSVYLGLPEPPYISTAEEDKSMQLIQAHFSFVARVAQNHKERFGNYSAFKGYYSDVEVVPSYIIDPPNGNVRPGNTSLPAQFTVMYWRELYFLAGFQSLEVVKAPILDLTWASSTSLVNHTNGLMSIMFFAPGGLLIRDGRGDGRSAYYSKQEANQPIQRVDNSLYEILRQKNSSVNEKTTYSDVYYASIAEFLDAFNANVSSTPLGLVIEAYNSISSDEWCGPIDPKGSGMNRKVQRVHKDRLDKAIQSAGDKVNQLTAFAWDPLFTCTEKSGEMSLYEEIHTNPDEVLG